jgi:hypothetical protein
MTQCSSGMVIGELGGDLIGSVDACFGKRGQGHLADAVVRGRAPPTAR